MTNLAKSVDTTELDRYPDIKRFMTGFPALARRLVLCFLFAYAFSSHCQPSASFAYHLAWAPSKISFGHLLQVNDSRRCNGLLPNSCGLRCEVRPLTFGIT